MSVQIIRPKDRTDWLKERAGGIGSSEVATILGLNPYETPCQLWRRAVGIDLPKEETFAMKAGHYLEDAVSRFWSDATGREIIKQSSIDWIAVCREKPWMRVSPDRTYWLGERRGRKDKGILECKTTQMQVDPDNVPKHWFCQLQYQLGVTELTHGSLAWLCSGRDFGYAEYSLVPEFFEWMADEVEKFYRVHIIGGEAPTAINSQDVLLMFPFHTAGKTVEMNEETYEAYTQLKEIKAEMSAVEERKKELEERIKMFIGDAEAASCLGRTLATWKAPKPSLRFDEKSFKADHPDIYNKYLKEQQGARRFLLK